MSGRRGFTLLELLVVVLIIATLSALSIDLMRPSAEERIQGAVRLFARDVEWARSATLTNPDDPVALRLASDGSGWTVSRNSTPETALVASDGSSMRRTFGTGSFEATSGVRLISSNASQRTIEFEPFGGVRQAPASVSFALSDFDTQCRITFESGSGNIQTSWINP